VISPRTLTAGERAVGFAKSRSDELSSARGGHGL